MLKIMNKRLFRLVLACISLLLLINMMQETYAKYVSSADASSNFTIARWSFLVNTQDVLNNSDFSNTIVPVFENNINIRDGVIAPNARGYFDITIDSSNVGVSFDEVITVGKSNTNTVTDLVFTGYKKNNDATVNLNNQDSIVINNTHSLGSGSTTNTYRFFVKWNDALATESMNNAADTAAANGGVASVSVNLQFIQKSS